MGSTVTKLWVNSYDFYHTPCEKDVYLENDEPENSEMDGEKDVNTKNNNNNNNNINLVYEDEKDEQNNKKSENIWKKEIKKVQEIIEKKQQEENDQTPDLLEKSTSIQETQETKEYPKDDQVENKIENNVDKIEVEKENSNEYNKVEEEEEKSDENTSDDDSKLSSDFEFDNSFDDVEYSGSEGEESKEDTEDDKRQTYTQIIQPTVNKEEILNFKFKRIKRENDNRPPPEILQEYIDTNQWQEEWNQLSKELLLVDIDECTAIAKMPENKNKSNYSQFFTFVFLSCF